MAWGNPSHANGYSSAFGVCWQIDGGRNSCPLDKDGKLGKCGNHVSPKEFWQKAKHYWELVCDAFVKHSGPTEVTTGNTFTLLTSSQLYGRTGCLKSLFQLLTLIKFPGSGISWEGYNSLSGYPYTCYTRDVFSAFFLIDEKEAQLFLPLCNVIYGEAPVVVNVKLIASFCHSWSEINNFLFIHNFL